ncbi:unnamed protein product [Pleuronectes platessa]|uniref:Uncharacterized protein n=1 Tax=Pleuronectes platessa TaxID=8262 RepID=A0A9N7Y8T0_PLEPL|nr:unnamed protein product [Pleuronectes platessa]
MAPRCIQGPDYNQSSHFSLFLPTCRLRTEANFSCFVPPEFSRELLQPRPGTINVSTSAVRCEAGAQPTVRSQQLSHRSVFPTARVLQEDVGFDFTLSEVTAEGLALTRNLT